MNAILLRSATMLLTLLMVGSAGATTLASYRYDEDFKSRQFCDETTTTADWDTLAGVLRAQMLQVTVMGTWDSPGSAYGVAVAGNFAYLADNTSGLQILDVSDPGAPALLGTYNTAGSAWDVDVEGVYAYVADGSAGLRAVSIANPAAPAAGGVYNTPGTAYAVDVDGNVAYVADGTGGLYAVFVGNPLALTYAGNLTQLGLTAYDVEVVGDVAWVAADTRGLLAIDVSNPAAPVLIGTANTAGSASGVAVDGDYAYVADGIGGLAVVAVGDPISPVVVATLATMDRARGVAVDGNGVYIADILGGVHFIDVSDPLHPELVTTAAGPPFSARAVVVDGAQAYVADYNDGLRVLRIGERLEPVVAGTVLTQSYGPVDLEVDGNYVYSADVYNGIKVIDISDPMNPIGVGTCDTDNAFRIDIAGDYLYVGESTSAKVTVIDISVPENAFVAGSYTGTFAAYGVTAAGDHLYVASQAAGLTALDITDPAHPTLIGNVATHDWAYEVEVAGDRAYVADYRSGLTIVDISNPAAPALLGNVNTTGDIRSLEVAGDLVFAAGGSAGLYVIDVHNPAAPTVVATLDTPYDASRVSVAGDLVYVADRIGGLYIVDVTDPLLPQILDIYDPAASVDVVAVSGDHLFLGLSVDVKGVLPLLVRTRGDCGWFARSLALTGEDTAVRKVRLSANHTGGIAWELRASVAAPWQPMPADGVWHDLTFPGDLLAWQGTLDPDDRPVCTSLGLSWLTEAAAIGSVTDVPGDQGGRVRVRFARSAFDFTAEATPITGYNVWRRVDDAATLLAVAAAPTASGDAKALGDIAVCGFDGRVFATLQSAGDKALPSGMWEVMGSFWAGQQDEYVFPTSTQADSSASVPWAVYCVTAHTAVPSQWYASAPDSGYSVDNLAPNVPTGFAVAYGGANALAWDTCPLPDFRYFRVYRSTAPGFTPDPSTLVHSTTATAWVDDGGGYGSCYLITATDFAGNESAPAEPSQITGTDVVLPARFALAQNQPNPFNPQTTIKYDVPVDGRATLRVYDIRGALIRTLVDADLPRGSHQATWDGRDASGRGMPSGSYFARLEAGGKVETVRMSLIR